MVKYDALIIERSGVVQNVADFNLSEMDARACCAAILGSLHQHLFPIWVETNTVPIGGKVDLDDAVMDKILSLPQARIPVESRRHSTYYARKADSLCVRCGSASLFTTVLCEACCNKAKAKKAKP